MNPGGVACLVFGSLVATSCVEHDCADESVEFVLPTPGDGVEIVVEACASRRLSGEITWTLTVEGDASTPLAILVEGSTVVESRSKVWTGMVGDIPDVNVDLGSEDCEPGRKLSFRRLDADPELRVTGTLDVGLFVARGECSATITVTPLPP